MIFFHRLSRATLAALLLVGACASDPPAPAPIVAGLPAVASLPMAVVPEAGEAAEPTQLAAANGSELQFLEPAPLASLDEAAPAPLPVVVDRAALEAAEAVRPAGAEIGYLVLDLETGAELAARNPDLPLIPASTAKLVTAIVALDVLGPEHRYRTELRARGRVANGVLEGDLVLRGGGDPLLDLADLLELAVGLRTRGIQRVTGDFLIDDLSLPRLSEIEPTQPLEAAYNPGLGALSLAFNRVHVTWRGGRAIEATTLPPLDEARFQAAAPALLPPGGVELAIAGPEAVVWRLADRGRRLQGADLPVKDPGLHAGAVFRRLALAQGVLLAPPQRAAAPVEGGIIAVHQSAPLRYLVHDMLLYSNNMMAELIGLSAAARLGAVPDLAAASALLLRHLEGLLPQVDWRGAELANHSGLDGGGRMTARQLAAILRYGWRSQALPALLPASGWSGTLSDRYDQADEALRVWAKTGSVNYGNALAGFLFPPTDRPAVFVAMVSDLAARAAYDALARPERADEARAGLWTARARAVQGKLIDAWLLPVPTS
jgi:serine-type D-Ala-D-Ala carboxypeptidase/endopeptidase (penicillin-binding protein 4)